MNPGHGTSGNPKETETCLLTAKTYTIESSPMLHPILTSLSPSTRKNVMLGMEIPQIYKQKYIHGHLANLLSNLDSYYIVFLMV